MKTLFRMCALVMFVTSACAAPADAPEDNAAAAVTAPVRYNCRGFTATIVGTPGDDFIQGTTGNDVIVGLGGDDVILGLDGDDIICGGEGGDILNGDDHDDILDGQGGVDQCDGGNHMFTDQALNCESVVDGG